MNDLVTLDFHGASLIARRGETPAETLVAMRPVVEGMGLDWKTQHRKLDGHPVLGTCVGEITTQMPSDDQARRYTALPLNRLNFWLATIHPNKVPDPDTRAKVIRYQIECADVLFAHFFGKTAAAAPAITEDRIREIVAMQVAELLRDQRAVIAEGYVTAHDIRAQHVADQKHGPKPASISIKLAAYAERTGNQAAMTRERGGLRPRRLFSLVIANMWLRTEGAAWISAATDRKRGQGTLRLVPKGPRS